MESVRNSLGDFTLNSQQFDQFKEKVLSDSDIQAFLSEHESVMNDELFSRSLTRLVEFVNEKERIRQTGSSQNPGFEPILQMGIGYIDIVYRPTVEYLRMKREQEQKRRITVMNMPKNISNITLQSLDLTKERTFVWKELWEFLNNYSQGKSTKGLYIYGSYGIGKTYIMGALANELSQRGHSSLLVHFPSLVIDLKAAIGDNSVQDKLKVVKEAEVLIIDDIGGESMTNWVRDDILMPLLDYRMRDQLPTFFTSNLTMEDLLVHFRQTSQEDDERKAIRLMERVHTLCTAVHLTGSNRRRY